MDPLDFIIVIIFFVIGVLGLSTLIPVPSGARKLLSSGTPIRKISELERKMLTPYLNQYRLKIASEDVYSVCADGFVDKYVGGRVKHRVILLNDIKVILPYMMDKRRMTGKNVTELVIVRGVACLEKDDWYGMVLKINDHDMGEAAQKIWGTDQSSLYPTLCAKRKETAQEYVYRQNGYWYAKPACMMAATLSLLAATVYVSGAGYMILLLFGLIGLGLALNELVRAHRDPPKTVTTLLGQLTPIYLYNLYNRTHHGYEYYLGLDYHLQIPKQRLKVTAEQWHLQVAEHCHRHQYDYQAEVIQTTPFSYQLLSAPDLYPIDNTSKKQRPVKRALLFVAVALLPLILIYPFLDTLDVSFANVKAQLRLTKVHAYTQSTQITSDPPKVADSISLTGSEPIRCATVMDASKGLLADCNILYIGAQPLPVFESLPDFVALGLQGKHAQTEWHSISSDDFLTASIVEVEKLCDTHKAFDCDKFYNLLSKQIVIAPNRDTAVLFGLLEIDGGAALQSYFNHYLNSRFKSHARESIQYTQPQPMPLDTETRDAIIKTMTKWLKQEVMAYQKDYYLSEAYQRAAPLKTGVVIELPKGRYFDANENTIKNKHIIDVKKTCRRKCIGRTTVHCDYIIPSECYKDEPFAYVKADDWANAFLVTQSKYNIAGRLASVDKQGEVVYLKLGQQEVRQSFIILSTVFLAFLVVLYAAVLYFYLPKSYLRSLEKPSEQ